jgi:unsaturated chondroitin disaccharide hydrolase
MIAIRADLRLQDLEPGLARLWSLSGEKILAIEASRDRAEGAPVFTVEGRYTARGWTEWTHGFQYGSAILQFDATGDEQFLELGRDRTVHDMASHVTHMGVHDHGFNNVSTYGNLWRLIGEGRIDAGEREQDFHELALKASGAVQARRWTPIRDGRGFIYSFNGPHSLFADTVRSLRALAVAHKLGHVLLEENDSHVSLLERLVQHAHVTVEFNVYYGEGRDSYDVRGRVAHESIFNTNDGRYRCPSTQQGYSPFTTWTRGLSWIMLGCTEQLEFLAAQSDAELASLGGRAAVVGPILQAARATCDFYIEESPRDGIPYWDTGAPGLVDLGDYRERPADPFNVHEPVDSSAAAIGAQALLRLGHLMRDHPALGHDPATAGRYWQAGLTVLDRLLEEPYLSTSPDHQGLLLHSVYHRPSGWDHVARGAAVPSGESSMWGDYHLREAALYLQRVLRGDVYLRFFGV